MRTDPSPWWALIPFRVRSRAERGWRWASGRSPQARWGTLAAALLGLVAAGYALSPAPEGAEMAWLFSGQVLPREDVDRGLSALEAANIRGSRGPRGQIAVPSTSKAEALAVLAKHKVGPRGLREIREQARSSTSIFEGPSEREDRKEMDQVEALEVMIAQLPGISSANVRVSRGRGRTFGGRPPKIGAIVLLNSLDDQAIPPQTIDAIRAFFRVEVPDLPDDALTIIDPRANQQYLIAGNPSAGAETMAHAREEELRGKIQKELGWIDGVRVFVTLETPPATVAPAAVEAPHPNPVAVAANQPLEIASPAPAAPATPAPAATCHPKAEILVQVPVSHYMRGYENLFSHKPTLDELKPYVGKVDDQIRATVRHSIPIAELADVNVDRIDDPGPARLTSGTGDAEGARLRSWLLPAATGGSVVAILIAGFGMRWFVVRRPVASPIPAPRRASFDVGDSAGPSERVRELVRLDPSAAAGVLQRWIGQGGHAS